MNLGILTNGAFSVFFTEVETIVEPGPSVSQPSVFGGAVSDWEIVAGTGASLSPKYDFSVSVVDVEEDSYEPFNVKVLGVSYGI